MGDQDGGNTAGADNISNVGGNHQPCLVVQGAEGFIQKKKSGLHDHGSDQGSALLHTAGELSRFFVLKFVKPIVPKELFRKGFFFGGQGFVDFRAKEHVLPDGAPFQEMILLEHIADTDVLLRFFA